jgi:hypothetical protein
MTTYKVLRRMEGDKLYAAGDTRELSKADAAHLVKLGVLEPVDADEDAAKAEAAPLNKMESAPLNKGEAAAGDKLAPVPKGKA